MWLCFVVIIAQWSRILLVDTISAARGLDDRDRKNVVLDVPQSFASRRDA